MSNTKNLNCNVVEIKTELIDYLYKCVNLANFKYSILKTFDEIKVLKQNTHHVCPNFNGNDVFIVFKKLDNVFYSVVIEKKMLKYNKSRNNLDEIKLMPLNTKAKVSIYNGTILAAKLIRHDNKNIFMINDVFYLEGINKINDLLFTKLEELNTYIAANIKFENANKVTFEINKLYSYDDIYDMIKSSPYKINGIIFYPYKSGGYYIFNNLHEEKPKNKNIIIEDNCAKIQLKKRNLPDVYDTYILDNNEKLARTGIAYISTMEMSNYCKKIFSDATDVIFRCKYNNNFQKWEPITKLVGVDKPDNISVIKKLLL